MNLRGLFHLGVIYIAWGSTYLAIRVAVREGAGFPPLTMSAMRVLAGCLILFALASFFRKGQIVPTLKEFWVVAISGMLLWLSGNGLVAVAETKVHSSYTAVIIGATPLVVALMEALIDRRRPSLYLLLSLLIGIAGVAVLNGPALLARDLKNLWAWGYLVIFGSVIAFTSFVKALRLLPTGIVMTYAYVNPLVAVFLGWLILGEPVTIYTLAGMTLIVLGVMGVFRERRVRSLE